MKRLIHITFSLVLIGLLAFPAERSHAQDRENDKTRTVIEIKDGKVFMNGEEIAELEDSNAPVLFKRSGDDENFWFPGEDFNNIRNGFVLRRQDGDNAFQVRSSPRAFGFMSRDGGDIEFFEKEAFGEAMEAQQHAQRMYAEVLADNMAQNAIEIESLSPRFNLLTRSNALSQEGREADRRSREIASMLRREEGDADQLEAELDEILGKVFDEKQAAQQERIDEMREKLMELEQRLDQRQSDRSDIISKRKNELLGRSSRYDW